MRKLIIAAAAVLMLFIGAKADYDVPVCISVNGVYINTDAPAFIEEGITYVPVRFISEAMGADVSWNAALGEAVIYHNNTEIRLPVGEKYAYVNGNKQNIAGHSRIVLSRTFVPVRFITETLGAQVNWLDEYHEVAIYKNGAAVPQHLILNRGYDNDHILWLSRIINSESSSESMTGKIAVGNVILNRVDSSEFPNTIYGVIFDDNYGIQFQPVMNGTIYNTPTKESFAAAKLCLEGTNVVGESLYFLNPKTATNFWIMQNRVYYTTIGNHMFYL